MRTPLLAALVLVLLAACGAGAEPANTLDRPLRVAFRDADAQRIRASIVAWDEFGFLCVAGDDGDVRIERSWTDLSSDDAYNIRRRLIDADDGRQWLALGVLMLQMDDARRAEKALALAVRRDTALAPLADEARSLHAQGKDPAGVLDRAPPEPPAQPTRPKRPLPKKGPAPVRPAGATGPGAGQLLQDSVSRPDDAGAASGVEPWKTLSQRERTEATRLLRERVDGWLNEAGLGLKSVETENFILYSDGPESQTRADAGKLDRMYDTLIDTLEIQRGTRLFHGRCVVFIFQSRDDFVGFETAVFKFNAKRVAGVCHQRGQDVYVAFYRGSSPARFDSVLIHECVHAFMYRYRSPGRLPTWANEGLADYVAGHLTPSSTEPQSHWQQARNFVMGGGDASQIMDQSYANGRWFDENSYPVSHMLVRFMLKYEPRAFKQWIDDIKAGKDWKASMASRFGIDQSKLAVGFAREMKTERRYTRLR